MSDRTVSLNFGAEKVVSATKVRPLGTKAMTPDGRVFWYSQNGAVALSEGRVVQARENEGTSQHTIALKVATDVGDWDATAVTPGVQIGKTSIGVEWVTNHSSAEYADGWLNVETTPAGGYYRIQSDPDKGDSATNTVVRLHPDDGIVGSVLTTVSKLGLFSNVHSSVIVAPATAPTNITLGVTPVSVPISQFFWLQSAGEAMVRYNDLIAALAGKGLLSGLGATAGDVIGSPGSTVTTTAVLTTLTQLVYGNAPTIGYAMDGIPSDGDFISVMLTIRG